MISFISTLFVAAVTSLLTIQLALWRYRSEKWWDRKVELYSRLIEAIYDMHAYNSEWIDDYTSEPDPHEDKDKKQRRKDRISELWGKHQNAQLEIDKLLVVGAFVASEEVLG